MDAKSVVLYQVLTLYSLAKEVYGTQQTIIYTDLFSKHLP